VYLSVVFVQVWLASRRDDARRSDAIVVLGAAQFDGRPSKVLVLAPVARWTTIVC